MKVVFCGTPEIAVPALDALAEIAEIPGVVCQPDRPSGRGLKLNAPAVKKRALEMGLEVYQPTKMRDGSLGRWMREKQADAALVIAYGRILTLDSLKAPRLGCVNLHASLLPLYRGAAPIQRVLMDGRAETGVCLMQMDEGMDTGPVLAEHRLPILHEDDAATLTEKLGRLAAEVTRQEVPRFLRGELTPRNQDHSLATHAPPITREDSPLDWSKSAKSACEPNSRAQPPPRRYHPNQKNRRVSKATQGDRREVFQPAPHVGSGRSGSRAGTSSRRNRRRPD